MTASTPSPSVPSFGALEHTNGLVDAGAAAELLAVPRSWVLAEARADRIPHVRLGRYVRFEPGELVTWWQSRRRGPWRSRGAAAAVAAVAAGHRPAALEQEGTE